MNILRIFGIGNKSILEDDHYTTATITRVTKCWWIKINRKPVRINGLEGAKHPHVITFTYNVDGIVYKGKRYMGDSVIPPHIGETILVYYNEAEPKKYAIEI